MNLYQASGFSNGRKPFRKKTNSLLYKTGITHLAQSMWPYSLTVVNYHRIDDPWRPGLDSFRPNISASPEEFDQQMAYLKKRFNVVSIDQLVQWLGGDAKLPRNTALITFDDGYRDNYTNAFPVLRKHKLPATIFLTSAHIGTDEPFYWDLATYCFHHTGRDSVVFPYGQERGWRTDEQREVISRDWVESLKELTHEQREAWARQLPEQLDVSIPKGHFKRLMMDWDMARAMQASDIRFGGHTVHHPILTRVPRQKAREEIRNSKAHIEEELGRKVLSFAYPNGMHADWNKEVEAEVRDAGYRAAFTLLSGPASWREVKSKPLAIRRVFVSHKHGMDDFAALMSPLNRLGG